jgi:hypothetical protein
MNDDFTTQAKAAQIIRDEHMAHTEELDATESSPRTLEHIATIRERHVSHSRTESVTLCAEFSREGARFTRGREVITSAEFFAALDEMEKKR